jgi:hypothetical protein
MPPVLEVALAMITHSKTCEKRPLLEVAPTCVPSLSWQIIFYKATSGAKLSVGVSPTKSAKVVRRNAHNVLDVLTNILDPLFHKLGELLFLLQIYM